MDGTYSMDVKDDSTDTTLEMQYVIEQAPTKSPEKFTLTS
jgi:hypothetical protein